MPLVVKKSPRRAVQMHRRHSLKLPLPVTENQQNSDGKLLGFAKNISAGGLFIMTRDPLSVGSKISLRFRLPNGGLTVACQAEVVWSRPRDPYSAYDPGMGIKFLDLNFQSQALIDQFVREESAKVGRR